MILDPELLNALLMAGDTDEAGRLLTTHLAEHPDDASMRRQWIALESAQESVGRLREALRYSLNLLEATSEVAREDRQTRVRLYLGLGDWESALRTLDSDAADEGTSGQQYIQIALRYAEPDTEAGAEALERADEIAHLYIEDAITRDRAAHGWQVYAGDIARREWRWSAAISYYTGALDGLLTEVKPDLPAEQAANPAPLPNLGQRARLAGSPLLLTEAGRILLLRAACAYALNQFADAGDDYANAARLLPHEPMAGYMAALMQYLAATFAPSGDGRDDDAILGSLRSLSPVMTNERVQPMLRAAYLNATPHTQAEMRAVLQADPRLTVFADMLTANG